MDTRPQGQIIITGTPGPARAGLLWDKLQEAASTQVTSVGGLDYGMGEEDDPADEAVWWRCHPGLASGLTDIEIIRDRYHGLPLPAFMQEYLGYFPRTALNRAIDDEAWEACRSDKFEVPQSFALSIDVSPDSGVASLVAAWRDPDGYGRIALLAHKPGTNWVPKEINRILTERPQAFLCYDDIGAVREVVEVTNQRYQNTLAGRRKNITSKDVQNSQSAFVREVYGKQVRHMDQTGLNAAVEILQWREVRESGRWFSFKKSGGDITPVRAAGQALWMYDKLPQQEAIIL
jgi:hypothetical protein